MQLELLQALHQLVFVGQVALDPLHCQTGWLFGAVRQALVALQLLDRLAESHLLLVENGCLVIGRGLAVAFLRLPQHELSRLPGRRGVRHVVVLLQWRFDLLDDQLA